MIDVGNTTGSDGVNALEMPPESVVASVDAPEGVPLFDPAAIRNALTDPRVSEILENTSGEQQQAVQICEIMAEGAYPDLPPDKRRTLAVNLYLRQGALILQMLAFARALASKIAML